ncbi:hypothetical protein T08_16759 [Trichinella sp. T8]|nr:hypothetical protein T08_16759 [Trichinella sp. T8]
MRRKAMHYSYRKKICYVLYSCEPRVIALLVGFHWQEIRNEILLLHCKPMEGCLERYILTTQQKAENIEDEDDSVILFQGLSRRLAVARTEKQLKQSFQVVSRWKAVYNETPVEFLPGEGKPRRGIAMKMNEMFSVTPSGVETEKELKHSFQVVSRWKAVYNETPVEFISEEGKTRRCIRLNINQMFSITPGNILWFLCTKLNVKRTSFIVALLPIYS